jgi:predicted XRE-type DNA-binding protein
VNRFAELWSTFCNVREQFEEAETLEQRQQLVAISQQIIKAADSEIEEFRRRYLLDRFRMPSNYL